MSKELYVGSLSYETTEYDLEKLFSVSGRVTSVHLIVDLTTGEFKGCGYVRMSTEAEAKDAVDSLDQAILLGRQITVSIANKQRMKPQGGGVRGHFKPKGKPGGSDNDGPVLAPKPVAAKPAADRPAADKKTADYKAGAAKAAAARPAGARPGAAKTGFSKPAGGTQTRTPKGGKR
jgi:RNA recognition motif-containing protein